MEKYKGTNKVCECGLNPGFLFNDVIMEESKKYKVMILTHVGDYPEQFIFNVQNFAQQNPDTQYVVVSTIRKPNKITFLPNIHWQTMFSFYSFLSRGSNFVDRPRPTIGKHFISLHGRPTWYRQQIFYHFNLLNILDKSYFSYLFDMSLSAFLNMAANPEEMFNRVDQQVSHSFLYKDLDRQSLFKSLPYKNFTEENMQKNVNFLSAQNFYNSSAIAVETETYVNDHTNQNPGFTEKIIKPLMFGNPFLVYSSPRTLSLLKAHGFETYSNILNEDYDNIDSDPERLQFILDEVARLSKLSLHELTSMVQSVDDVIEHNQNHILTTLPDQFDKDLEELGNYIERLLQ
jgi:hypothetical protein